MINADDVRGARVGSQLHLPLCAVLAALLLGVLPPALTAQQPGANEMRAAVEQLRARGWLRAGTATVQADPVLLAFYEQHRYAAAWTVQANVSSLERAIAGSTADGLDPDDYYRTEIARSSAGAQPADPRIDILRSAALIKLSRHLRYGKVPSQYPAADSALNVADMARQLRFVIASGIVEQA